MSKPNNQIRSAIQNLNIKKPYDLRSQSRPRFQAPRDAEVEPAQNKDAQIEQPGNEPTQNKPTQNENAQIEQANIREARSGFFMLAHSVFDQETVRNLSGDSFRVFIFMSAQAWRYQHSKGEFRGAVEYISLCSGCSRSTVSRAIRDLKQAQLIECVEQNFKKGNLWKVSSIASGRNKEPSKEDAQIEHAEDEQAQFERVACSKRASSVLKLSREHAQNDHHLISSNKINNKSEDAPGPFLDIETIWEKFREAYPNEKLQEDQIRQYLVGIPFGAKFKLGQNMAVMKWWDALKDGKPQ